ncbi:hypothetical protein Q8A67_012343 [Cirrhinus molitorella]|uniref:Pyrin domain-containing protein n=1 Tax=Cirrhinus molitorella TaxID=172907 RepID=A0AA88PJH2_9TELE|nr:hypothetical protein Q8A67_012343 [Cirrhinus molitorella]
MFKWLLKNHKGFSKADLEKANTLGTVDLMMNRFGPEEAVKITVDILRRMNLNQVAKDLENKHEQAQAEASRQYPAPSGAQSKPINATSTNIVPRTREDFLQYYRVLTLDLKTMNKHLRIKVGPKLSPGVNQ